MLNQGENWRKLKETLRDQIISNYQSLFVTASTNLPSLPFCISYCRVCIERRRAGVRLMSCSLKWGMTVSKRLPFYVIRILSQFKTRNITQSRVSRSPRPVRYARIFSFVLILNIKIATTIVCVRSLCLAFSSKQKI